MYVLTQEGESPPTPSKALSILLVSQLSLVRIALKQLLSNLDEVGTIREAVGATEAETLARHDPPDIAIIDAHSTTDEFPATTRAILLVAPSAKVIILSDEDFPAGIIQSGAPGIWGYIPRDISQAELARAVRTVASGRAVVGSSLLPEQFERLTQLAARPATQNPLSRKEWRVFEAIAKGHTDNQIAGALGVSVPTVKTHVRSILKKMGARNRAGAVTTAFRSGLLT